MTSLPEPDGILITRPEPGASQTAARVAAMGLTPVLAPVLAINSIPPRLPPPQALAVVLMASGNAAAPIPAEYHSLPVLTVGAATARRARAAGFTDVSNADGDAAALTDLVMTRMEPAAGTVLLAAGQGQSLALAAALRAAGYTVIRRVVYAAVPVTSLPDAAVSALRAGRVRAALFFSAETARHFIHLAQTGGLTETLLHCEAITIGAPAGVALKGSGWSRVRVAARPTQDEMLALLR